CQFLLAGALRLPLSLLTRALGPARFLVFSALPAYSSTTRGANVGSINASRGAARRGLLSVAGLLPLSKLRGCLSDLSFLSERSNRSDFSVLAGLSFLSPRSKRSLRSKRSPRSARGRAGLSLRKSLRGSAKSLLGSAAFLRGARSAEISSRLIFCRASG